VRFDASHAWPDDAEPPHRVLVVDDNRDAAESTAWLLDTVGFETRACFDGLTALRIAEQFRPGVCLLDLHMPGMDGFELAGCLHEWAADRPLVLVALTAMDAGPYRAMTAAAGFDVHLVKPVDPVQLVEVVDALYQVWDRAARWT
jgi:two-component system, OmpR family, response regulator